MREVFNHHMLNLARRAREKSQFDLAKAACATQSQISKIEDGFVKPKKELVMRLASALRLQPSFFYDCYQPIGGAATYHKRHSRMNKKLLDVIKAQQAIYKKNIEKLWVSAKDYFKFSRYLPSVSLSDYENQAYLVARALRCKWRVPCGPIDDMVDLLESAGIIVVNKNFGTILFNGLTTVHEYSSSSPPVIFMDPSLPKENYRLALAHELGHLVMHRMPYTGMEDEADQFAVEFLMPAYAVRESFRPFTMNKLGELKEYWKIPLRSILRYAHEAKKIDDRKYSRYSSWIAEISYGKDGIFEPLGIKAKESPELLDSIINFHIDDLKYSEKDFMDLFGIYEDDLSDYMPTSRNSKKPTLVQ